MAVEKMQTDEAAPSAVPADAKAEPSAPAPPKLQDLLRDITALIEKAVKTKDTRMLQGRLLRLTAAVRKQLNPANIKTFLQQSLAEELEAKAFLVAQMGKVGQGYGKSSGDPGWASLPYCSALKIYWHWI